MVNLNLHVKIEHDPYGYKSALDKFDADEKTRLANDEKKRLTHLKEISDLKTEIKIASVHEKLDLEKKLAHMKEHESELTHSKPSKKPQKYSDKFLIIESDIENKFDNDDSAKFNYGSKKIMESNFVIKNLYDKNTILAGDASGIFLKNNKLLFIFLKFIR